MTTQRLFVAVPLDDDLRHALAAWLDEQFSGELMPGRPVPPQNWHLTLRFCGKTDARQRDLLLATLDQADLGGPFSVPFGGLGAFPRPAKATVLWLACEEPGATDLVDLAATVEASVVAAGYLQEERPFHPHLTLSRIRPQQNVTRLVEDVSAFPRRLDVDRVVVYESKLQRGPATYLPLEEFLLRP